MMIPLQRVPDPGCDGDPMPGGLMPGEPFILAFERAFTLSEVAERLGISLRQVQAHVADGRLAAVNVGRGLERKDLRVLDDDLDAFVRSRTLPAASLPLRRSTTRRRRT